MEIGKWHMPNYRSQAIYVFDYLCVLRMYINKIFLNQVNDFTSNEYF